MKSNSLVVSETFYSIQGEGVTMGVPAVFLRLGGCNLLCESEHWRCDTIEVWRKGKATLFKDVLNSEWIKCIDTQKAHLVITGGEPLMQQSQLSDYLLFLRRKGIYPTIEIETNGTVEPNAIPYGWVHYWNISPKLPNSGMSYEKRVNETALAKLSATNKAIFKFVISNEQDLIALEEEYGFLPHDQVMLMPAGDSIESLSIAAPMVAELCKRFGFRYSHRLHISLWNKKTGV